MSSISIATASHDWAKRESSNATLDEATGIAVPKTGTLQLPFDSRCEKWVYGHSCASFLAAGGAIDLSATDACGLGPIAGDRQ
jgi:hypothetical protein